MILLYIEHCSIIVYIWFFLLIIHWFLNKWNTEGKDFCTPLYNQICVNNHTICSIPDWYDKYEPNKIKLCNGICYDSAIQRCINGILIDCTPSWSFERCKYEAIDCLQYGNTTLLSTLTPPTTKLTSSSLSSSSEILTTTTATPSYASSIYIQLSCLHISLIVVVQMLNTNFLF